MSSLPPAKLRIFRLTQLNDGIDYVNCRQFALAMPCFDRSLSDSVDEDPDGIDLYCFANLAICLHTLSETLSIEDYERLYYITGVLLSRFEEFCSGLKSIVRGTDEDDIFQWKDMIHVYRAESLRFLGHLKEVIWNCTDILTNVIPNSIATYLTRAICFAMLYRYDDALLDIEATETIARDEYDLLSSYSKSRLSEIPRIKAYILSKRQSWNSNRSSYMDGVRELTPRLRIEARNSEIVRWGRTRIETEEAAAHGDARIRFEMERIGDLYRFFFDGDNSVSLIHRTVATDLAESRPKVESVIEFYVQNHIAVDSCHNQHRGLMALELIDLFKTMSFVPSFSFASIEEIEIGPETLARCSTPEEGIVIVCYAVISPCRDDGRDESIVRWVIVDGSIVGFDQVNVMSEGQNLPLRDIVCFLSASLSLDETKLSSAEQMENCRLMYELLLGGIEDELFPSTTKHVIFVPDAILFRIPFGCMLDSSDRFFIERFSISVSSSLWMIQKKLEERAMTTPIHNGITALICESRSPMPDPNKAQDASLQTRWRFERGSFSREVRQVMTRCRKSRDSVAVCLRDQSFSFSNFSSVCSTSHPKHIHIISHGTGIDPTEVRRSFANDILYEFDHKGAVQCSESALLARSVAEFVDLRGTDLVYLSSCSLGDGEHSDVGVLGFYRACIVAGCTSVICSLWPVLSKISRKLAIRFYQQLSASNTKAEALQSAIVDLIHRLRIEGKLLRDYPAFWCSFQLFGSPT